MRTTPWSGRGRLAAIGALALAGVAALAAIVGPVALPSRADAGEETRAERTPREVAAEVDRAIEAAWRREGLQPNARCTDEEFVRRVHLDIVGTIPTAEQVEQFLADPRTDRRAALVETLLATPGAARHLANQWAEVLVGTGTGDNRRDFVPSLFLDWLERQAATGRPYGEWVTELLTAEGTSYTNPPVNFTGRKDYAPTDLAGAVSKSFLGVQIQCAQCHDHPYEDITQKDFASFSAFWGRMRLAPAEIPYDMFGPQAVERERRRVESSVQEMVKNGIPEAEARVRAERQRARTREVKDLVGDAKLPRAYLEGRGRGLGEAATAPPKFLKGAAYTDVRGESRRAALAKWITSPENPYTARALANRVWGWFLGRGIVHPVDDFQSANPATVPEALDALARDTAAHAFDVKRLIRIVTATRAYQTSTASKVRTPKAREFFAAGPLKPLTPQQSFDSLHVALGIVPDGRTLSLDAAGPSALEMEDGRGGMARMAMRDADDGPPDRAQAAMAQAARGFFQAFEDDEGNGDASFEGTVPQGLFLLNSRVLNAALSDRRVAVAPRIVANWKDDRERVRQLFLRTLSRAPTAAETSRFVKYVKDAAPPAAPGPSDGRGPRRGGLRRAGGMDEDPASAAYADVLWVLVSSSEFGSNH